MLNDRLKKNSLKHLLMGQVGIIGVLLVLASLILNVFWFLHHETETMELEFNYIERFVLEQITESVRRTDVDATKKIINDLDDFEYVKQIDVFKFDQPFASTKPSILNGRTRSKTYPLNYRNNKQHVGLGYINVSADLSLLYFNVLKYGLLLFLVDILLISVLVFSIYHLFNKGVFEHLQHMALFMSDLAAEKQPKMQLNRSHNATIHDELDDLVEAFNEQRTELVEKNSELELSQEKFFKIFDSSPNAILITSFENGKIIEVNRSFYRLYEFDESDDVIGKTAIDLKLWSDTENREHWKKQLQEEGEIYLRETTYRKKSGFTSDCTASMQLIDFGDMLAIMTTIRDISQTKRYQEKLIHSQERLHNLAKSQEEIRENERLGISREIHDELGQSFTSLKIDLYWLRDLVKGDESTTNKISHMIEDIDQSVETVRRISSELRPPILDDLGLVAAIEWYTSDFSERTGIANELKVDCEDLSPNQYRDTGIFRIYQEALTNIARHSQASCFQTSIELMNDHIVLNVKDNGVGITDAQLHSVKSIGIIGMQERAANIDAEVMLTNLQQGGTEVILTCPINS